MKRGWLGVAGVLLACEAYVGCADVIGIEELSARADGVGLSGTTAGTGTTGVTGGTGTTSTSGGDVASTTASTAGVGGSGGQTASTGAGGAGGSGGCVPRTWNCDEIVNDCDPALFDAGPPGYFKDCSGSSFGFQIQGTTVAPRCLMVLPQTVVTVSNTAGGPPDCNLKIGVTGDACGVPPASFNIQPAGGCVPYFCSDKAIEGAIFSCP